MKGKKKYPVSAMVIFRCFIVLIVLNSLLYSEEKGKSESPFPEFVPYAAEEQESEQTSVEVDIKELGKEQPARWVSVDPMADKYPGWSPYNYVSNNPMIMVDPNGMWEIQMQANKEKFVSMQLVWQEGDNLNTLAEQTGYSVDELKGMYDEATITALENGDQTNLSSFGGQFEGILEALNKNFNPDILSHSNCFGVALSYSETGKVDFQRNLNQAGEGEAALAEGFSQAGSPRFGDVVRYANEGGEAQHYGVYLLNNNQGTQVFSKLGYSNQSYFTIQYQKNMLKSYPGYGTPQGKGGGSAFYRKK